jgi:hypothetical protein
MCRVPTPWEKKGVPEIVSPGGVGRGELFQDLPAARELSNVAHFQDEEKSN